MENPEIELVKCQNNFFHFLKYVRIVDAPTQGSVGGVIPFELWEHLRVVSKMLLTERLMVICKARQIGISWTTAAYVLWHAMFHKGSNWLLFSKTKKETIELLEKCQRVYHHLPSWMWIEIEKENTEQFSFKQQLSAIRAFSGLKFGGTGFTASGIVSDEWDLQENDTEIWYGAQPTIFGSEEQRGQFIGISTVNPLKAKSMFQNICREARNGESPFKFLFIPWDARPGRTKKWYRDVEKSTPEEDLQGLSRATFMRSNYPGTADEALTPSESISAIKQSTLKAMEDNAVPVMKQVGMINFYQEYHQGDRYVCFSDPSAGIGKDYAPSLIFNTTRGNIAADMFRNDVKPRDLTEQTMVMCKEFRNPLWGIEANEYGRQVIQLAQDMEYPNLYWEDKVKGKCGLDIKEYNRGTIWNNAVNAIDDGLMTTPNKKAISQLRAIIRNPEKSGRLEAAQGEHDDYLSALAGAWHIKGKVRESKFYQYNYVTGVAMTNG